MAESVEAKADPQSPAEKQHSNCLSMKDYTCTWDPTVRFMLEQIQKLGCNIDVEQHIKCVPCKPRVGEENAIAGGFHPEEGILMCEDAVTSKSHFGRTLTHELIHVFDSCRAKVQWTDLRHQACSEIRAANLSGECRYFIELMQSGNFRWKEGAKECVRRRTLKTMVSNPNHTPEKAEAAFNEVFERCFHDSAPFAMPP